jgi:cation diffusion facilitator CzcD-associated flavoprotein CzcO
MSTSKNLELDQSDELYQPRPTFQNVKSYDRLWKITVKDTSVNKQVIYVCPYVSVATGHHVTPNVPTIKGEETFTG